jgi:hypothetical protein
MPNLLTFFRRRRMRGRMVRIHLRDSAPSLQGIYKGCRYGLHTLDVPRILTGPDQSTELAGFVAVPIARVDFIQALPEVFS